MRHLTGKSFFRSLALALIACGPETAQRDEDYSARDSAGVHVVIAGGVGERPAALLQAEEILRIGHGDGAEGEELFFRVAPIRVDDSGWIYVADASNTVRVFDSGGTLMRRVGRGGEGPGEFKSIVEILVRADTTAVHDVRLGRVTRFDKEGDVIDVQRTIQNGTLLLPFALVPGGWLVSLNARPVGRAGGLFQDTTALRHVSSMDAAFLMKEEWKSDADSSSPIKVPRPWIYYTPSGTYRWGPLWTPQPSFGVDRLGRVYVSEGLRYQIDVYDHRGALVERITRSHEPVPITSDMVARYSASAEKGRSRAARALPVERPGDAPGLARSDVPHGESLPAIGRLLVSPSGSLWLERPDLTDDPVLLEYNMGTQPPSYWDVLDENGRYTGTIGLPGRFTPMAVNGLTVFGVAVDDDDVEAIVAYRIMTAATTDSPPIR